MKIREILAGKIALALKALYGKDFPSQKIPTQKTRPEFEGDITVVVFPFLQLSKKSPEKTADDIGNWLRENVAVVSSFNVIKGFLNLIITETFWSESLFVKQPLTIRHQPSTILLEYSSPNTNKPLHLGHIRNCLLGYSVAKILEANGDKVIKTQIVNDRGIHICKSMLAWKKWGRGETPQNSGMKGDKLVGNHYVEFDKQLKIQQKELPNIQEEKDLPLMKETQDMLRMWEAKDDATIELWKMLNSWVYAGFAETYKKLGVNFDKNYYESETYLYGKKIVEGGLGKGIFFRKEDGSVWCNLTKDGLEEKVLLRSDGTSVYITQDIGTAIIRLHDFPHVSKMIYTVGNEQDYHFKVLFAILKILSEKENFSQLTIANRQIPFYHLSYGMVDLPSGKMKSREGTVVDADDLIDEMIETAKKTTEELGKSEEIPEEKRQELYRIIGLGALKYFILKVDPKKRMLFNPQESIDFNGNTGPFIQYTYARIQSLLRKAKINSEEIKASGNVPILPVEKILLKLLYEYNDIIKQAADEYSPATVANYAYELAKEYNHFYQSVHVLTETDENRMRFRLLLSQKTAGTIKSSMELLGIEVPDKM